MSPLVELRETPLDCLEVERAVAHSAAGAIVNFIGRVRDHSDGNPVTRLEYEAYPSMAVREMLRIVEEIEQRVPGTKLSVLHRVGSLNVGDAAVVCAASAAHRSEAFEACRMLIDEIKSRVPIWKREHGPDGPYWVGWADARCSGEHAEPAKSRHHHDHHQGHGHQHASGALSAAASPLVGCTIVCITVSDTRRPETDESGSTAERLLMAAGARVERLWVRDDSAQIAELVSGSIAAAPAAILLTGGTGIGPRDVTCEVLAPLLERHLDGFGEAFRRLSYEAVGTRAILSRAIAGTLGQTLVFAVPGSPNAVRLALEQLVIPMIPHARSMLQGEGH